MSSSFQILSLRGLPYFPFWLYGVLRGTLVLLFVTIFRTRWLFNRKTRTCRPACMEDPELGTHRLITIQNLTLHVVESGDHKKPLMLFFHGFPECWYAWRHQIRELNKDYHCVSFDMRGAGESDAPVGKHHYSLDLITRDIYGLIGALGHTSCILVGHDSGGMIAWDFVARYPEMVHKLIVINAVHPGRFMEVVQSYFVPQLLRSWYVWFFQLPYLPELLLSMNDFQILEHHCKKGPASDNDIEAFKFALSRPGRLRSFINFYRTAVHQFRKSAKIHVPTLFIWSTAHYALHNKLSEGHERFCTQMIIQRVDGADLLIHQEQPGLVNKLIRDYLQG